MSTVATSGSANLIHADPTKDFFVTMITRDIDLQDCIFDLLDNSIDGARRTPGTDKDRPLLGKFAHINFDSTSFEVVDNCGGIKLSDAIDYAFHFGRKPQSPTDVSGGIGLYGIGMKRAIFKIGAMAEVISEADDSTFKVTVDVRAWEKTKDWDFEYTETQGSGVKGTTIKVSSLNPGIATSFDDPVFKNELIRLIARDYAFFIAKGFEIKVGNITVPSYSYKLRENDQLAPAAISYTDDGVTVHIVAGLIDDLPSEIPDELSPKDVERYGWYVVCNDRVVLAANKTDRTVWGDDGFKVWHPQYNGFAGFVFFQADDQRALPWTTTKRQIDTSTPLYRRTLKELKAVTEDFIAYTNRRKEDLSAAKAAEVPTLQVDVYKSLSNTATTRTMKLPVTSTQPTDPFVNISYRKKLSEISEVRNHLRNQALSFKEIGALTFDYYMEAELGK